MRFMILVKATARSEAGEMPDEAFVAVMAGYHQQLVRSGVLLDAAGLHPSSKGWRFRHAGGQCSLVEGPFAESRDLVAGYAVIQVRSREEAIEWTRRFPAPHGAGVAAEIEVRQVFERDDFGRGGALDRFREVAVDQRREAP